MTEPTTQQPVATGADPTLGALVNDLTTQVPQLIRSEIRLAQAELTEKGKKAGLGIGMFGAVAAFVGKAATAQVDPRLAAIIVVSALIGSPIGAWVSVRTRTDVLMRLLAALVLLASIRIAWSALSP